MKVGSWHMHSRLELVHELILLLDVTPGVQPCLEEAQSLWSLALVWCGHTLKSVCTTEGPDL